LSREPVVEAADVEAMLSPLPVVRLLALIDRALPVVMLFALIVAAVPVAVASSTCIPFAVCAPVKLKRAIPFTSAPVEFDVTARALPVAAALADVTDSSVPVVRAEAARASPVPDVTPLALTVRAFVVVAVFELTVRPAVPVLIVVPLAPVVLPRVSVLAGASVPILRANPPWATVVACMRVPPSWILGVVVEVPLWVRPLLAVTAVTVPALGVAHVRVPAVPLLAST
jgi:hypothetical protein